LEKISITTDRGLFTAQLMGVRGDWVICWPAQLNDSDSMRDFARILSRNYRVVMCDPPAVGLNRNIAYTQSIPHMVYFAQCVLKHLDIARCHWVGHSAGGVVGMALYNAMPNCVQSLTLASTPMLSQGRFTLHIAVTKALLTGIRLGRRILASCGVEQMGYGSPQEKKQVIAYLRKALEQCDPKTISSMRPLEGSVVRAEFDKLRHRTPPLLILCGRHDSIVLPRDQRTVAEITQSPFALLPCGHMSLLIEPEQSAHAFARFMQTLEQDRLSLLALAA
jgi:3-oxoadipate enol-lactonase